MSAQQYWFNNASDFETHVALTFKREGYEVTMPPANTKGYDIELRRDHECIAVQVKNQKAKCNVAQVQRFLDFLDLPIAAKLTSGWFISSSGFFKPALTHVQTEQTPVGVYFELDFEAMGAHHDNDR